MAKTVNISVSDDQRKGLLEYYAEKLEKCKAEIEEIESIIVQLENAPIVRSDGEGEYRVSWSWALKTRFVLNKVGRCLSSREIIEELGKYEELGKNPINSVSGTLSSKVSQGVMFGRYQPYQGDYYFGLKEWFNEDGSVKPEYAAL